MPRCRSGWAGRALRRPRFLRVVLGRWLEAGHRPGGACARRAAVALTRAQARGFLARSNRENSTQPVCQDMSRSHSFALALACLAALASSAAAQELSFFNSSSDCTGPVVSGGLVCPSPLPRIDGVQAARTPSLCSSLLCIFCLCWLCVHGMRRRATTVLHMKCRRFLGFPPVGIGCRFPGWRTFPPDFVVRFS